MAIEFHHRRPATKAAKTKAKRSAARARRTRSAMELWAEKIGWKQRVRAVCKPCWEIKYCPYGPLVEDFPLREERDERSCRIFGHDCPVFYVAEPFTETKDLRNISRHIPRPVQFRVLKRENQICRECGNPVQDEDIHFDHIIPFSRGGSSDEHNIRLLCGRCNLRKGAKFEDHVLVQSPQDHMVPPLDRPMLQFLLMLAAFSREFRGDHGRMPAAQDLADDLAKGKLTDAEKYWAQVLHDLNSFFEGKRPSEIKASLFRALRERWGFGESDVTSVKRVAERRNLDANDLFYADVSLVQRLGFRVDISSTLRRQWADAKSPV